jgi:hypothetical protein
MSAPVGRRPSVFISYRRADTDALAGRIKDRLATALPGWDVFMDVASLNPGADFRAAIDERIARASVFVVLIGKRWAGDDGTRIRETEDLVRHEIRLALFSNIRVIPVLVNDAHAPTERDLPDDIAALAHRHAVELRHSRFDDDFANLARAISGKDARRRDWRITPAILRDVAFGALIGLGAALVALVLHFELTGRSASERIGEDGATLVIPVSVMVGALIGYWRAARQRWP